MQDEAEVFARRIWAAGGTVCFDGFEGMPHCFAMVPWNKLGRMALNNWAGFCRDAVLGGVERREMGTWTDKHDVVKQVALGDLGMRAEGCGREEDLDDVLVGKLLAEQKEWRVRLEGELRDRWGRGSEDALLK